MVVPWSSLPMTQSAGEGLELDICVISIALSTKDGTKT